MKFIKTILFFAAFMMVASLANAQLIATNNLGNYDPTGPFNLNGKFASLGESGGVPGPTGTGCDLYGFRAQVDSLNSVNLGMQNFFGILNFPTLSFEGLPFLIAQSGATGSGGGPNFGCGKVLGAFFDNLAPAGGQTNVVFSIFGSGAANGGFWVTSDKDAKTDIQDISNPMGLVMRLKGVTYKYDIDGNPTKNFKTGRHYGFIAEDVQRIVPEAVQKTFNEEGNIDDFVVMNYDMIVPILIEGMKSQQETIRNLESRILVLEEITGAGARAGAAEAKDDEDTTVSLGQNRPNPFKGMTTIDYTIPASMNNARLVVYDANGSVIETIALDPGAGTVDYNAGRLSAGIYFYAIEADGQNLARQMMVVK